MLVSCWFHVGFILVACVPLSAVLPFRRHLWTARTSIQRLHEGLHNEGVEAAAQHGVAASVNRAKGPWVAHLFLEKTNNSRVFQVDVPSNHKERYPHKRTDPCKRESFTLGLLEVVLGNHTICDTNTGHSHDHGT